MPKDYTPYLEAATTLGGKQKIFSRMVADLIIFAYEQGYQLTLGDAYRDKRVFGTTSEKKGYGNRSSNHKRRLAIDLNLFSEKGTYLTSTKSHEFLGEYWESIGGTWGGRFNDGNHYSVYYKGYR